MISYLVYRFFFYLSYLIFNLYCGFKVYGAENVPKDGAVITASNHVSWLDPSAVGVALKRKDSHYLARASLFEKRLSGFLLRNMNAIPVKRNARDFESIRVSLKVLESGGILVIFPEGTRSQDGSLKDPQLGIGFITCKTKAPVLPVYVKGSEKALPKGASFIRRSKIEVFIGKPIDFVSGAIPGALTKDHYKMIARKVMDEIAALKVKADAGNC